MILWYVNFHPNFNHVHLYKTFIHLHIKQNLLDINKYLYASIMKKMNSRDRKHDLWYKGSFRNLVLILRKCTL